MKRWIWRVGIVVGLYLLPAWAGDGQDAGLPLAPVAPPLVMPSGQYTYLSRLYYPGPERPRQPRCVVVLNFMALDCPPCRRELPQLLDVVHAMTNSAAGARFFLVNTDKLSRKEELLTLLAGSQVPDSVGVLLDPYGNACKRFGVDGVPRTIVISPYGHITADIAGAVDGYVERLTKGIEDAGADLGGQ